MTATRFFANIKMHFPSKMFEFKSTRPAAPSVERES